MAEIQELTKKIKQFSRERDWEQFHNHKDMAIAMALEANEVLEHFLWKNTAEQEDHGKKHKNELAHELADVAKYLFQLAYNLNINLETAIEEKMQLDTKKYPIHKAKGNHKKYKELGT